MYKKHLLVTLLGLCAVNVQAEIYKCTDENGRTTFSEKPCGEDAEVVQLKTNKSIQDEQLPSSTLLLSDGSVQPYKNIISMEVKTKTGYKTGKDGLYVFHNGTDHVIAFDKLISLKVINYDRKPCGNTAHLCNPSVLIKTDATEINTKYEALRNIKILIDDELTGEESELVVWFATDNEPRIKQIMF